MSGRRASTRQSSSRQGSARQGSKQRLRSIKQLLRRWLRIISNTTKGHPAFQYQPITGREIRILHFSPGQTGDGLVGDLLIGDLDDQNCKYDALSYMWGDPAPAATIRIGNQMLPIARNLNDALQRLRYPDKTLAIWADAICINQNDDKEKVTQVPLMRRLYSNAKIVRIWINEFLDAPLEVIKALQNFQHTEDIGNYYGLSDNPTFYKAVMPLFLNPYWSRVWVQQEVINAKDLAIHCVNADFEGETILEFYDSTIKATEYFLNTQSQKFPCWNQLSHIFVSSFVTLLATKHLIFTDSSLTEILTASFQLRSSRECDYLYASTLR